MIVKKVQNLLLVLELQMQILYFMFLLDKQNDVIKALLLLMLHIANKNQLLIDQLQGMQIYVPKVLVQSHKNLKPYYLQLNMKYYMH